MEIYNKIIINDEVILDLSSDTITTNKFLEGVTAHDATGMQITGKIKKYNKEYTGNLEILKLKPTMYSYNGTVLPALPEWDKEAYPYAFIARETEVYVSFYALAEEPYHSGADYKPIYNPYNYSIPLLASDIYGDGSSWGKLRTGSLSNVGQLSEPLWSNFDIKYKDGIVYLAASEPVPVVEPNTLKMGSLNCKTISFPSINFKHTSTWERMPWENIPYYGSCIWTDGGNIYYSLGENQYVLNGDTWEPKVWNGLPEGGFSGSEVWTDGTNIYYSRDRVQCVLNGDTWEPKTWNGYTSFRGDDIWTDGTNYYCEDGWSTDSYVLNGDTWEPKVWNGLQGFFRSFIWTDEKNIYYSAEEMENQYVLNGDTWEPKVWNGVTYLYGSQIWTDGENIYSSRPAGHNVLNGDTWEPKTWNGYTSFQGGRIWTDGKNIYHSDNGVTYILK